MNHPRLVTVLAFIFIAVISRLLPHAPNFTSINAIALFGAFYLGSLPLSLGVVFASMLLSDIVLGFHPVMPFVYLSYGLIVVMGYYLPKSLTRVPVYVLGSSTLFFVLSNFGVWLMGTMYPKTLAGLQLCYAAAIPFFANQVVGDLVYGALIFGCFALMEKLVPRARHIA